MTHSCSGDLDHIGFVVLVDHLIDAFFPVSDVLYSSTGSSCSVTCSGVGSSSLGSADQGVGGAIPCACQLFNTLIPWRNDPSSPVSCNISSPNCQNINLCCPLVKIGIASNGLFKFVVRAVTAIWQPWNGLPEFFTHFVFCDETAIPRQCGEPGGDVIQEVPRKDMSPANNYMNPFAPPPANNYMNPSTNNRANRFTPPTNNACGYSLTGDGQPACNCGRFTCGTLQPTIDAFTDVVTSCLCEIVKLLDALLVVFFNSLGNTWANCFCGHDGLLQSAGRIANVILTTVIQSIRKSPLPCFWNPTGYTIILQNGSHVGYGTCTPGVSPDCTCVWVKEPIDSVESSWIYSVLGPLAQESCQAVGNFMCVLNSLFFLQPECIGKGSKFLGGTVRWGFELVFRIASFIEGFVRQFTDPQPTCVGDNPMCNVGQGAQNEFNGVVSGPLARILTALLSYPIDFLLGDSDIACSRICLGAPAYCDCWNLSPQTAATDINLQPVFELNLAFVCEITKVPAHGAVEHLAGLVGLNNITGFGATFPTCTNLVTVSGNLVAGTCAQYNLCRPDTLPTCGRPTTPEELAGTYKGPIDGVVMALVRYISCAINSPGEKPLLLLFLLFFDFHFCFLGVMQPLIWIISYIWQLLGGFINFQVTLLLFLLSLVRLTTGCACHEYVDPKQNNSVVHFVQDNGALCYACPDAHAMCGPAASGNDVAPFVCEPHCPVFHDTFPSNATAAQATCVGILLAYSDPTYWTQGGTQNNLCDGSLENSIITAECNSGLYGSGPAALAACKARKAVDWILAERTQSSCAQPYCQVGGSGNVPRLGFTRGSNTGRNQTPQPSCFIVGLFDGVARVFNAFIAIFTQPFITPTAKRWSTFDRSVFSSPTIRETRASFWDRVGITKKHKYEFELPGARFAAKLKSHGITSIDDLIVRTTITTDEPKANLTIPKTTPRTSIPNWLHEIVEHRKRLGPYEPMDDHLHRLVAAQDAPPVGRYEQITISGFDGESPSAPEAIAIALWDYDSSDCFDDTPACICRNFNIPEYCTWSPVFGTIATPSRKRKHFDRYAAKFERRRLKKRNAPDTNTTTPADATTTTTTPSDTTTSTTTTPFIDDSSYDIFNTMTTEELMSIMEERFTPSSDSVRTTCDHTVVSCAEAAEYDEEMGYTTMEGWVHCIDKRVQGERLSELSRGVFEPNFSYRTQSPLDVIRNIMGSYKRSELEHRKRVYAKRSEHRESVEREFPRLHEILQERAVKGREYMERVVGVCSDSPITQGIVQMDHLRTKYQMGYYHSLASRAYDAYHNDDWHFLTTEEALLDLRAATSNLFSVVYHQPYVKMINATVRAISTTKEEEHGNIGQHNRSWWSNWNWWNNPLDSRLRKPAPEVVRTAEQQERRRVLTEAWNRVPLVQWWRGNRTIVETKPQRTLAERMHATIRWRRQQENDTSVWSTDLQYHRAVALRTTPRWTQNKLENWKRLARVGNMISRSFSGEQVSTLEDRLLFDGNCKILDRTLELTLRVFDYCAHDYVANTNFTKRMITHHDVALPGHHLVTKSDPHARRRYRFTTADGNSSWHDTLFGHPHLRVEKRTYKRAINMNTGPAHFNFIGFLVDLIDRIVQFSFNQHR